MNFDQDSNEDHWDNSSDGNATSSTGSSNGESDYTKYIPGRRVMSESRGTHQKKPDQGPLSNKVAGVEYISGGVVRRVYLKSATRDVSNRKSSSNTHGRKTQANANPSPTSEINTVANGGVILTAGALMTPKLLMNSGIGRPEILEASRVKVRVNSSQVGRNLRDHPAVGVVSYADPAIFAGMPSLDEKYGVYVYSILIRRNNNDFRGAVGV